MAQDFKELSLLYKAFCDDNRLQIIDLLSRGEHCACDLLDQLQIGQSTLSHHLQILINSGVISSRRSGKWTYYALNEPGCGNAIDELRTLLTKKESALPSCVCEETKYEIRRD